MGLTPSLLRADAAPVAPAPPHSDTDLDRRIFCGYQGWFRTPDDGANLGFVHYAGLHGFKPGSCGIELWPDVAELDADEKHATDFRHADGSIAQVFSSHHVKTVERHFQWMSQYDIDGAFLQRFPVLLDSHVEPSMNDVLSWSLDAADKHGRRAVIMYDLTGLREGQIGRVRDDWAKLMAMHMHERPLTVRHGGKPLVALWGVGFADRRAYTLDDCRQLVRYFKSDAAGGCAVMLGVPFYWRDQKADAVNDPMFHDLLREADVLSPWSPGRYGTPDDVAARIAKHWSRDAAWCEQHGLYFMPVAFPGFSWHNLEKARGRDAIFDAIPRRKGEFFWSQIVAARAAGARSVYIAMFDELDEGTAIFKCDPDPPIGETRFVNEKDLPSDHYLWLTSQARAYLRADLPDAALPKRN